MKLKRLCALLLSALLLISVLSACRKTVDDDKENNTTPPTASNAPADPTQPAEVNTPDASNAVRTGLAVIAALSSSNDAFGEFEGLAQSDIMLIAVTVDSGGVIDQCVIDGVQGKINFSTQGKLLTDLSTTFPSKQALGDGYGLREASGIGKEWNEQANALAEYASGKTVADLKGIALDNGGHAADADLAASVTIRINDLIEGIGLAVDNATDLGASKGDKLGLASETTISGSKDASAGEDGLAQACATIAAVTTNGGTITSCYIDSVQADVGFDAEGLITTELTAIPKTKNQLGSDYGMHSASSIGKEWNEQVAAFCEYVTGKTVSEVTGLSVDGDGKAADTDLAAAVTLSLGQFLPLIEQAAK